MLVSGRVTWMDLNAFWADKPGAPRNNMTRARRKTKQSSQEQNHLEALAQPVVTNPSSLLFSEEVYIW